MLSEERHLRRSLEMTILSELSQLAVRITSVELLECGLAGEGSTKSMSMYVAVVFVFLLVIVVDVVFWSVCFFVCLFACFCCCCFLSWLS